jgi:hypothetical protein
MFVLSANLMATRIDQSEIEACYQSGDLQGRGSCARRNGFALIALLMSIVTTGLMLVSCVKLN